jgi:CPA1 family monovalent cation:H+ antiporter
MHSVTLILILFALTTALSLAAVRVRVPYPTAMVVAGLLIGAAVYFFPWLDGISINLEPEVLFTAILPPLLYGAAWNMSWNGFRENLRAILMLAIGAVIFTTVGVALLAIGWFPGFTWPVAFALGAIVSPPDAVAATSVIGRLRIPKRIVTILEGESLMNDATALVVYQFAVAAAMGGAAEDFSLWRAVGMFPLVAGGGVLIGALLAWVLHKIHERIEQPLIETALTLLAPYGAYMAAEELHFSGVLAVVVCGLIIARHSPHLFSPQTRLTSVALWNFFTFMLNGLVCILIGLQLPAILKALHTSFLEAVICSVMVAVTLVVLRVIWVFPGAYLPRLKRRREWDTRPAWKEVFLVGWVGMRGVVSLASALALPETLPNGKPFPARDLILFITFAVILATLVAQSLTLEPFIRALKLEVKQDACEEVEARRRGIRAALDAIADGPETHARKTIRGLYEHRLEHLQDCGDLATERDPEEELFRCALRAQRDKLVELRNTGQISDEVWRKLERELDLEESRIG